MEGNWISYNRDVTAIVAFALGVLVGAVLTGLIAAFVCRRKKKSEPGGKTDSPSPSATIGHERGIEVFDD